MKSTISLYRRLFSLPSTQNMLILILAAALISGVLTELLGNLRIDVLFTISMGALRGLLIILPASLLTGLVLWASTSTNGILDQHRIVGMVTAATFILLFAWFLSTLLGWLIEVVLKFLSGSVIGHGVAAMFYRRSIIFGAALTSAILFLAVLSMSRVGSIGGALISLVFPTTSIVLFILSHPDLTVTSSWIIFLVIYLLCAVLFIGAARFLLTSVGRPLKLVFNVDGIQLFRGFLEVWMEGKADQMEACLTQIGQEAQLPLSVMRFDTKEGTPSLIFVISGVHPGPFKDTGSSALPSEIARWGRESLEAIACAPHSTSTHDLNLVSHKEVNRFLEMVQRAYDQTAEIDQVSQHASASSGTIQAGCQIFGDTALITISRSPYEMDDISRSVGELIRKNVMKLVKQCIVVDTHNCMTELKESVYEDSELVPEMIEAAITATRQALATPREQAKLGVITKSMSEYSEDEGMGPEGITVAVFEVAGQKMAYVLIDGNNMVAGLRDKILKTLIPHHVEAAEILTTDTHQTAAISATNGYSSIGERIPHDALIEVIKDLVENAKNKLQPVKIQVFTGETEPLLVMGEGTVDKLTQLIPVSAKIAKRMGITSFSIVFILTLLLLLLI